LSAEGTFPITDGTSTTTVFGDGIRSQGASTGLVLADDDPGSEDHRTALFNDSVVIENSTTGETAGLYSIDGGNGASVSLQDGTYTTEYLVEGITTDVPSFTIDGNDVANIPTTAQKAALDSADSGGSGPSGGNPFVTVNELGALGGGDVSKTGTPVIGDFARFTGTNTIEGRDFSQARADLEIDPLKNGFEDRADCVLTWDNGTRTLTLTGTFDFWSNGEKFTSTGDTFQISDVEGDHFIYYDNTGTLQEITTFDIDLIKSDCYVAYVYWDATNNEAVPNAICEQHGSTMDTQTHLYLHHTKGTAFESGLALTIATVDGSGDNATDAQFASSGGIIWDEDIEHTVTSRANTDNIPVLYRTGAAGDWRMNDSTAFPLVTAGSGRAAWNQFTGGAWQLTEVSNTNFVLAHIYAIPGVNETNGYLVSVLGQAEYGSLALAREGALSEISSVNLTGLPSQEFKEVATIIFQTNDGYTNAVRSRVRSTDAGDDYIDWRLTDFGTGGSAAASAAWGNISGTLSNQVDLQAALDAKGSASQQLTNTNKLATIETGATADQTGSQIKALYEAQANTNAFNDAAVSKLAGIEALADVTDTANVACCRCADGGRRRLKHHVADTAQTTPRSQFLATLLNDTSESQARATLNAASAATALSTDEYNAVHGANSPAADNLVLTENDLSTMSDLNSRLTDGPVSAFQTVANEAALPTANIENRYVWAESEGTLWRDDGAGTWEQVGGSGGAEVNDLTAAVTWANIPDANVPESAVTQHEAALSIAAGQVASGTFDVGRISEASVTQHEDAIDHDALANKDSGIATYGQVDDQHRPILFNVGASKPTPAQVGAGVYHQTTDGSHELEYSDGTTWHAVASATGGSGDVAGGSTSVVGELAAYSDTSGKAIGRSVVEAGTTGLTGKTTSTNSAIHAVYNSGGAESTTNAAGAYSIGSIGETSGTTSVSVTGTGAGFLGNAGAFLGTATVSNAGPGTLIGGHASIIGAGTVTLSATSAAYGSIAWGSPGAAGQTVSVAASNAMQLGVGTNSEATSFQVGDIGSGGVRLIGDGAAAASPQNGDIHVASGEVTVRSNGVNNLVKRPPLSVTIESPTSGDVVLLGRSDRTSTIAKVHGVLDSGTSVVVSLDSGASRATSDQQHVNAQTVSSTTTGTDLTKTANLSFDEGDWLWVTIGTVTGTVDAICITVSFE
jgi:hypothetical protein